MFSLQAGATSPEKFRYHAKKTMKVIVFDDELRARAATYKLPELTLLCYDNADDAAAIVAAERPDVVLMDYMMHAQLDGTQAIAALKQLGLPLRIIAISGDRARNQALLAAGADDAVPKTHIRGYLQKLIERERLQRISG
jgi:CheY-like chemotaxis protein